MNKVIQISLLLIYTITSSMMAGMNGWKNEDSYKSDIFVKKIFSIMTPSDNNNEKENNNSSTCLEEACEEETEGFLYIITVLKCESYYKCLYFEHKIKNPLRNIFSPPPLSF